VTQTFLPRHTGLFIASLAASAALVTAAGVPAFAQGTPAGGTTPESDPPAASTQPQEKTQDKPEDAPEPKTRRRFHVGPDFGAYFPTSAKTRARFGQSWQQFSLGLGTISRPSDGGAVTLDFTVLTNSKGRDRATILPLGLQYRRSLDVFGGRVRPYVGASAGLMLAQLRSREEGLTSRMRGGYGGGAALGLTFGDRGYLEAGYRAATRIRGFDVSGASVSLGFRL
jgi:hypothetical protein